jgi:hypothetical protein
MVGGHSAEIGPASGWHQSWRQSAESSLSAYALSVYETGRITTMQPQVTAQSLDSGGKLAWGAGIVGAY